MADQPRRAELPEDQDESLIDLMTRYGREAFTPSTIARGLTSLATDPLDLVQWLAMHGVDPEMVMTPPGQMETPEQLAARHDLASSIPNAGELASKYLTQAGFKESETVPEQMGELGVSMIGPALLAKAPKAMSWGKRILGKIDEAAMGDVPRMAGGAQSGAIDLGPKTLIGKSGLPIDEASRMKRADKGSGKAMSEGDDYIYHTSPEKIGAIHDRGMFGDVLHFSTKPYTMSAAENPTTYKMKYSDDDFIDASSLYHHDDAAKIQPIANRLAKRYGITSDAAEDIISGNKSSYDFGLDSETSAQLGWDAQTAAAQSAKKLGYKGARGQDEQGSVYMVPMRGREKDLIPNNSSEGIGLSKAGLGPKGGGAVKEAENYLIPAQSIKSHSMPEWESLIKRESKNIENVPISWLSKLPGNAFRHSDEKINEMAKSIAENGLSNPLIISVGKNSRTAKLGEGNHRLEALKRAGFTHAPVKVEVGTGYGSEFGEYASYVDDLIPKVNEYFPSDAKPSEVFKSLKGITKATGGAVRKASGGLSRVNEAGNYTKPGMRKRLFNQIKASAVQGTKAGQWSARKAQLLAKSYKEKGGGYKD